MFCSTSAASSLRRAACAVVLSVSFAALAVPPASAVPTGIRAAVVDGELQIVGGDRDDLITVRHRAGDGQVVEVLTGLTRSPEFVFRRVEVERIDIDTAGGADRVLVDDRSGVVGEDTPIAVSTGDGDDTVTGGAGVEVVLAGAGADSIDTGGGDDQVFAGSGDDRVVWSPDRGTDVIEGQTGADEIVADATSGSDHLEAAANGSRLRLFRPGQPGSVDASGTEHWIVRPGLGADSVVVNDLTGAPSTVLELDLDKAGGGIGPSADGLGDGAVDTVEVAGTPAADDIAISHDGDRIEVTGVPSRVQVLGADKTLDRLVVDADLGADTLSSHPVVRKLMAVRADGGPGQDAVVVDGTALAEGFVVGSADGRVRVSQGADAFEATAEQTVINSGGGNDNLKIQGNLDSLTTVTLDGGAGADLLSGDAGRDVLIGGDGNDQLIGRGGADQLFMGGDHDNAFWYPGDGADVFEGGTGNDGVQVMGSAAAEKFDALAVGGRVRLARDAEQLDLDDVERTSLFPLGGADEIAIHELTGTELFEVAVDLAPTVGGAGGDGAVDRVSVDGTNGVDSMRVAGDRDFLSIQGLSWSPRVRHSDGPADRLAINTLAGSDQVSTADLVPDSIAVNVS